MAHLTGSSGRVKNAGNTRGRPFEPGNSGRPRGSRNKKSALETLFAGEEDVAEVARAVFDRARAGDMAAARLILDRAVPVRKGRLVHFELPDVSGEGLLATYDSVLNAIARGELTPEEAKAISDVIEARRRAVETVEFASRLMILEQRLPPATPDVRRFGAK